MKIFENIKKIANKFGLDIYKENGLYYVWENLDFLGNGYLEAAESIVNNKINIIKDRIEEIKEEIEKARKKEIQAAIKEENKNKLIESLTKKHTKAVALDSFGVIVGLCYAEKNRINLAKCVAGNNAIGVRTIKISRSKENLKKAEKYGCNFLNRHLSGGEFYYTVQKEA